MTQAEFKGSKVIWMLVWFNAGVAVLLVVFSVATFWNRNYSLPETRASVIRGITETQDIEALRKAALIIARSDVEIVQGFNEHFAKLVDSFARILRMMAILFVLNAGLLLKYQRAAEGRPIRWLGRV